MKLFTLPYIPPIALSPRVAAWLCAVVAAVLAAVKLFLVDGGTGCSTLIYASLLVLFLLLGLLFRPDKQGKQENRTAPRSGRLALALIPLLILLEACVGTFRQDPASMYHPWMRLAYFALMLAALGPLLFTPMLTRLRRASLWAILGLCTILQWLSAAKYLWYRLNDITIEQPFHGILFGGVGLSHIAALCTVALVALYCLQSTRRCNAIALLAAILPMPLMVLVGTSRIAAVALAVGLIAVWALARNRRAIISAIVVGAASLASLSLDSNATDAFVFKHQLNIAYGSAASSRTPLWESRIEEFRTAPLFGIGVGRQTVYHHSVYSDEVIAQSPNCEPGSLYLGLLAQTGILGLLLFLALNLALLIPALKARSLYLPLLLALLVLGIAEGYILAAGSTLALLYWLSASLLPTSTPKQPSPSSAK